MNKTLRVWVAIGLQLCLIPAVLAAATGELPLPGTRILPEQSHSPIIKLAAEDRGLKITRVALTFEEGEVSYVAALGEEFMVTAAINHQGLGFLQAEWEIAEPTSTSGDPVFRRLALVKATLGGKEQAKIRSPALPTKIVGTYQIRFRIVMPATKFEPVTLLYAVGAQPAKAEQPTPN